jgi:hypothetical protein
MWRGVLEFSAHCRRSLLPIHSRLPFLLKGLITLRQFPAHLFVAFGFLAGSGWARAGHTPVCYRLTLPRQMGKISM